MAREVKICPNCGAGIIGNPTNCPRCDFQLSDLPVSIPPEPLADTEEIDLLATVDAAQTSNPASTNSFENARTAPVAPQLVGITAPPTPPPPMPAVPLPSQLVQTQEKAAQTPAIPQVMVPPAPYTPPPLREATVSVNPYSFPSNYYLEQRVAAYRQGGYEMVNYTPYQVTMAHGKGISFFWWLIAMLSGVGFIWYLLILLASGFSKDRVYLIVERSGTLYEDGAGAAHVRRQRALVGRRWGFVGVIIFFTSLIWFAAMMGAGVWGVQNYSAELEAAYPTISLFAEASQNQADQPEINQEVVTNAESLVLAYSVLFALSLFCLLIGLILTIIGYLHSSAYEVRVIPLPTYK